MMRARHGRARSVREGRRNNRWRRWCRYLFLVSLVPIIAGCATIGMGIVGVAATPYVLVVTTPYWLASAESGVLSAEFSPGGTHVLVAYRDRYRSDIYRVSLDGETWEAFTEGGYSTDPVYSPDGSQIAFCKGPGPYRRSLHLMNADGSGIRKLTQGRRVDSAPRFSPDGSHIFFRSGTKSGYTHIEVIDLTSGETRQLTSLEEVYDSKPVFLDDGETVLFARTTWGRRGGGMNRRKELYTVRLDGTELRRVSSSTEMPKHGRIFDANDSYLLHVDRLLDVSAAEARRLASYDAELFAGTELPTGLDDIFLYAVSPGGLNAIALRTPTFESRKVEDFDYVVYGCDLESGKSRELLRRDYPVNNLRYSPSGTAALFIVQSAGPPYTTSHSKHHRELWIVDSTGPPRRIDTLFPGTPKWVLAHPPIETPQT